MELHTLSADPVFLMCPPDFFAPRQPDPVLGPANDFERKGYEEYIKNPTEYRRQAAKEYRALLSIYRSLGARIEEIEPVEGHYDLPFTADPSLSIVVSKGQNLPPTAITLLSNFTNKDRQEEVAISAAYFEKKTPDRLIVTSSHPVEGSGDNIYDPYRDKIFSGYTQNPSRISAAAGRSDIRAHKEIEAITGIEVISLAVQKPCFHVDLSTGPLPRGHIVCYLEGLKPAAQEKLMRKAFDDYDLPRHEYLIRVGKEDAKKAACNLVPVFNTAVMPLCSDDLQASVRRAGYEVVTTDVSHFIGGGGAVHCLTNHINQRRVVGGTANNARAAVFGFGS